MPIRIVAQVTHTDTNKYTQPYTYTFTVPAGVWQPHIAHLLSASGHKIIVYALLIQPLGLDVVVGLRAEEKLVGI